MVIHRYFSKIPQGIKFQFGAFLLIYFVEFIFKLLFIIVSFDLHSIPHIIFNATTQGLPLDLSITAYLLIVLNGLLFLNYANPIKNHRFKSLSVSVFAIAIGILLIIHIIVLFADIFLFHYWQWRINAQAIGYLVNWQIFFKTLPSSILFTIAVLVGATLWVIIKFPRQLYQEIEKIHSGYRVYHIGLIPVLFFIARGGFSATPINLGSVLKEGDLSVKVSSINGVWNAFYSISTMNSMVTLEGLLVDEKLETEAYNRYYPHQKQSDSVISDKVKSFWLNNCHSKPNVHLIILEGINQHWLERKNSPLRQLQKLSSDFLSFSRCYAVGDRTDKGLASLIAGWPGEPGTGILFSPDRWKNLVGLADILKSSHYTSEFWYGGDQDFANNGAFLKSMGFNKIYDIDVIEKNYSNTQSGTIKSTSAINLRKIKWGYSDISTAEAIVKTNQKYHQQQVASNSNPKFTAWLTLSTHEPFDIVDNNLLKSDKQLFTLSMKHLDSAVFNYISSLLIDQNEWDNSLVIIVSDHGKVFGLEDLPWSESEFFRIPLLVGGGALNKNLRGKQWESVVSQSDLYATLSYMLTNNGFAANRPWGRPMYNFNGFSQAISFKGDYSVLVDGEFEDLGHLQESFNSQNIMELQRRSLQSRIIRKYFR